MKKSIEKNKKNPLVTIITPTYNRAVFLKETMLSVLNQDYPNLEYIVLDDGSTDETAKIIEKFKKKVVWIYHKNIGEVMTVNKGLSLAHGEIISIVNSDDPLLPGSISKTVKFLSDNLDKIAVYPDWVKIDNTSKQIERITTVEYDYQHMLRYHNNITGPGTFFRKIVVDKLKGRDPQFKYVSDYDFWLRAGLIGSFARIPKILATSRCHSDQATQKNKGYEMAMEHIRVLNKIFSLPNLPLSLKSIKSEAYAKACEAARICRGGNLITKIVISLISLYYSPTSYVKTFLAFRLAKWHRLLLE